MVTLTIPIYMTEEDAKKFLLFQKYYNVFRTMDEKGVFDIQYGKATLNFAMGELQNVVKEEIVYHKKAHAIYLHKAFPRNPESIWIVDKMNIRQAEKRSVVLQIAVERMKEAP